MADDDDEEVAALVVDNGSGMCKGETCESAGIVEIFVPLRNHLRSKPPT
jgi:methyl coenzyme M reductase subunit C